ncbi:hypothetical protein BU23DRAFT_179267 [Bimuria novae-zelandiae CBS 107.79]|uniref:Uncharacterized protein n=1 Tax=Bimuria novae-zelandiae CBS 107.79 TaxID=1447943 RepID=A0A6A5V3J1_9PLEO|nr:hypothetical protein BU23DRAFT_179267 [Bimuria novae-zelandiae CBS 107.79]
MSSTKNEDPTAIPPTPLQPKPSTNDSPKDNEAPSAPSPPPPYTKHTNPIFVDPPKMPSPETFSSPKHARFSRCNKDFNKLPLPRASSISESETAEPVWKERLGRVRGGEGRASGAEQGIEPGGV